MWQRDVSNLQYPDGQVQVLAGAVSAPSYSFTGDVDTGMSHPTTNALNFVTGGSERVRIDPNGVMLVGSQTPSGNAAQRFQVGTVLASSSSAIAQIGGLLRTSYIITHASGTAATAHSGVQPASNNTGNLGNTAYRYCSNLEVFKNTSLYTIRHFDEKSIEVVSKGKKLLLEQRTEKTVKLIFSA